MGPADQRWRRRQRPPRGSLDRVQVGSADRQGARRGQPQGWLPRRRQGLRRRLLPDVAARGRDGGPAATPRTRINLGGTRTRAHPGQRPQGRPGRCVHRQLHQRLPDAGGLRSRRRRRNRRVCPDGYLHVHCGGTSFVLLRLPRAVHRARHRMLLVAGRGAPGSAQPAQRRVRCRSRRRCEHADHPGRDAGVRLSGCAVQRRLHQGVLVRCRRHDPRRGWRTRCAETTFRCPPRR